MNTVTVATTRLRFLRTLTFAAAAVLSAGSAHAVLVSTSFSASDSPAFANGGLDGQNTWEAHPSFTVSDAAGLGILNRVNANGPVHIGSSADVTSELAAGKTITLTLEMNFVGTFANQNNGAWLLGLSNSATGMGESPSATIGSAVFNNNGDNDFYLSAVGFNNGTKFDSGIVWDSDYHTMTTTITKSATTNLFDITADIDGQSTAFTMSHANLWSGADTAYAGFRWRGNQNGNVDSFSVSTVAVPEASQILVFSTFCLGLVASRRRK